jgi:hypothetical protein
MDMSAGFPVDSQPWLGGGCTLHSQSLTFVFSLKERLRCHHFLFPYILTSVLSEIMLVNMHSSCNRPFLIV